MDVSLEQNGTLKRKVPDTDDEDKNCCSPMKYSKNDGVITVGSRKSQLAVIQTESIVSKLEEKYSHLRFKIDTMETLGDKILHISLPKIGEKSLFTKDLEIALADEKVEFLVHSLKDLPTTLPPGMALGTIIKRDNPYDCVIFHPKHKGKLLADLPKDSVIGTSSLRRIAQLKKKYDHLQFQSVRGNLNTRLKKLEEEEIYDAIVLAKAGIDRMNWDDKVGQVITEDICLYAVGQGAIAVEIRQSDKFMQNLLGTLTDIETMLSCAAERAFMRKLNGGCSTPVGTFSKIEDGTLNLRGIVLSLDGKECLEHTASTEIRTEISGNETETSYTISKSGIVINSLYEDELSKAEVLGENVAIKLIELGADHILAQVRSNIQSVMNIQIPTNLNN